MTVNSYKHLIMAFLLGGALTLSACSGDNDGDSVAERTAETTESVTESVSDSAATVTDDDQQAPAATGNNNPIVVMETSMGAIEIELWADRAPISTENFLRYVDNNLYEGLTFHRVIPGFMIQGGGYDTDFVEMSGYPAISNEASPDLRNERGTLAMARTNVVDSATSQFFINLVDNEFLNQTGTSAQEFGYAAFGEVISGMEVVDEIATVETGNQRQHQNVPLEPVIIESVSRR